MNQKVTAKADCNLCCFCKHLEGGLEEANKALPAWSGLLPIPSSAAPPHQSYLIVPEMRSRSDGGGIVARIKAELAMSPFRGRLGEWMGEDLRMFRLNMLAEKII